MSRGARASTKRNLSPHVVPRGYRAPEIILTERQYWSAVDVWSFGCIVIEILRSIDNLRLSNPLKLCKLMAFQATSSFPLSPFFYDKKEDEVHIESTDLMREIIGKLGDPDEAD
jgi:serine/threonine protein kinase